MSEDIGTEMTIRMVREMHTLSLDSRRISRGDCVCFRGLFLMQSGDRTLIENAGCCRQVEHLMQYCEVHVRRAVPICLGLRWEESLFSSMFALPPLVFSLHVLVFSLPFPLPKALRRSQQLRLEPRADRDRDAEQAVKKTRTLHTRLHLFITSEEERFGRAC